MLNRSQLRWETCRDSSTFYLCQWPLAAAPGGRQIGPGVPTHVARKICSPFNFPKLFDEHRSLIWQAQMMQLHNRRPPVATAGDSV